MPNAPTGTLEQPAQALLVEGSAVARDVLTRVLGASALQPLAVHAVATPQEAPTRLEGFRVAMIDIDLDDAAALRLIAQLPRACWRVATTLYDEEERLLPALSAGIHGYLLKQDRQERQIECLQRVLRGRPEISPAIARSALDRLRELDRLDAQTARVLGALGRGLSVKETARTLETGPTEIDETVARVFSTIRHAVSQPGGRTT